MARKDELGRAGEDAAARVLLSRGYVVLDRNWRCKHGEIDIVAWDPGAASLVVCEVKTRSSVRFGTPAEAVTDVKLRRLRRLAMAWVADSRRPWPRVRLDVVAVLRAQGRFECDHRIGVG